VPAGFEKGLFKDKDALDRCLSKLLIHKKAAGSMRCPKCGYISYDFNLECPRCRSDITIEQNRLHLPSFRPSPPFLFGKLVGEENSFFEEMSAESFLAEREESEAFQDDVPERMDDQEDMMLEEEFDPHSTEGIQAASGSPGPPSFAQKHIQEIKELISELMPAKGNTESSEKKDR
jgi:hypothetical protein